MGPDLDMGLLMPDARRSKGLLGHDLIPRNECLQPVGLLEVLDVVLVQVRVPESPRRIAAEEAMVQGVGRPPAKRASDVDVVADVVKPLARPEALSAEGPQEGSVAQGALLLDGAVKLGSIKLTTNSYGRSRYLSAQARPTDLEMVREHRRRG
jgi:hypothetical protein